MQLHRLERSIASVSHSVREKIVISAFLKLPLGIFGQTMGANRIARLNVLLLEGSLLLFMGSPMTECGDQHLMCRKAPHQLPLLLFFDLENEGYDFYAENLGAFV